MVYEILFTEKASQQLSKLDKPTKERITSTLERIRIRPEHFIKKLVGEKGYKLRVGNYRIILDLNRNKLIVLVLKIGHRKNIYK